ncbi:MAG: hypothetical protein KA427_05540, partial [Trichococcus sp.]|nr:hypothetical protein [Trichococcus sp.]
RQSGGLKTHLDLPKRWDEGVSRSHSATDNRIKREMGFEPFLAFYFVELEFHQLFITYHSEVGMILLFNTRKHKMELR